MLMDEELAVDLVHLDGSAVLMVRGDVDLHSAHTLTTAVDQAVAMGVPVVVDLAGVTFMDSSGLHALVRMRESTDQSCPLVVRNPSAQAQRLLAITGLDDMMNTRESAATDGAQSSTDGPRDRDTTNR
jgi:anti-sigma B factor antagonist